MSVTLVLAPVDMGVQYFVDVIEDLSSAVWSEEKVMAVSLDANIVDVDGISVDEVIEYRSYIIEGQTIHYIDETSVLEAVNGIDVELGPYGPAIDGDGEVRFNIHFTLPRQDYLYSPRLDNDGIEVFRPRRYVEDLQISKYDFLHINPERDCFGVEGYTFTDTIVASPHFGEAVWNNYIYIDTNSDLEYTRVSSAYFGEIIDLSSLVVPMCHDYENIVTVRETTLIGFCSGIKILNSMVDATTLTPPLEPPFVPIDIDLNDSVELGLAFAYTFSPEAQRSDVVFTPAFQFVSVLEPFFGTVAFSTETKGSQEFDSVDTGEFHYTMNGGILSLSKSENFEPISFPVDFNRVDLASYYFADSVFSTEGAIVVLPHERTDDTVSFPISFRSKNPIFIYPFEVEMPEFPFETYEYDGRTIEGDQVVEMSGILSIRQGGTRTYPLGLFRDIFVRQDDTPHLQLTAHLPSTLGSFSPAVTRFNDIEAGAKFEVFQLTPHSFGYWKVNTDVGIVAPYHSPIIPLNVAPYVRVTEDATGDYITFGIGFLGGQILHMHKDGWMDYYQEDYLYEHEYPPFIENQLVDPILGSSAALAIASTRYQKHARVLYGVAQGEMWDDIYIQNAKDYLIDYQEEASLFSGMPYSPTVVASIIKNLKRGLVDKNIFDRPFVRSITLLEGDKYYVEGERESISYIYENVDDIAEGGCSYRYMSKDDHVLVTNVETPFPVHVSSDVFGISPYTTPACIEFCLDRLMGCEPFKLKGFTIERAIAMSYPTILSGGSQQHTNISGTEIPNPPQPILGEVYVGGVEFKSVIRIFGLKDYAPTFTGLITYKEEMPYEFQGVYAEGSYHSSLLTMQPTTFPLHYQSLYVDDKGMLAKNAIEITSKYTVFFPDEVETPIFHMVYNNNMIYPKGVTTEYSTIWLKVFPRNQSDTAFVETDLLRFFVTQEKFALQLYMPYKFISLFAKSNTGATKSSSGDIKEKKILETDDPFGPEPDAVKLPSDRLCGTSRTTTYLEMQAHSHMFGPGDKTWFGNYSWEDKERFMAGFVVELERVVTRKGAVLRDADALKRTLTELTLSRIEDLSVVEDWKIEDFKLNAEDVGLEANNGESFADIDEAFRAALKAAVGRLGEEGTKIETEQNTNMFPSFPTRPRASDQLATDTKVQQFIILEEPPEGG